MKTPVEISVTEEDFQHSRKWLADDVYKNLAGFRASYSPDKQPEGLYCANCPVSSAMRRLGYTNVTTGYSSTRGTLDGVVYDFELPAEAHNLIVHFDQKEYDKATPLTFTAVPEVATNI
jgi:hypothetical protein